MIYHFVEKSLYEKFLKDGYYVNPTLEATGFIHSVTKENIYGIGDSFVDIKMLSLAGHRFAINPKGGIDKEVDYTVNDLTEVISYI